MPIQPSAEARAGAFAGVQMTKSDLIKRFALRVPQFEPGDAEFAARIILEAMTAALLAGHRIELREFGSFQLKYRAARLGRNPRSGAKAQVPEKYVPHFRAGKELRRRVAEKSAHVPLRV